MRKIWDFHGGIHPPENKSQSNSQAIRFAGIPQYLFLPLQQHIGQPAKPVVEIGSRVLKGQLLADPGAYVSVPVHAPTSGRLVDIADLPVPHPSGMTDRCLVIETDGLDEWIELHPIEDYRQLSPSALVERIRQSGIAGLGGAGFPTAIKLHPPKRDKVSTLILNGAECEPYITSDDVLMRERADEVVRGMEIMASLLEPEECLIGIEDNKPEAIQALRAAAHDTQIEIVVIPTKYPSGGEKQLIQILTGLEVPSGGIPADVGVMCQNVGTAVAVYRAIHYGEPLISRITTLTGEALKQPCNLEVLLGTPIEFLLQLCGFDPSRASRLIMGGPMMGFTLNDTRLPIIKTSNCIMAVTRQEMPEPEPAQACIRCAMCAEACPAELLPQQLYWFARSQEFDKAESHNLFDCIECGACSYVCPSSIPLVQYYRFAKGQIRINRLEQDKADRARERFEFRKQRQEREQAEKEARRKARAEAAAQAQAEKAAAPEPAPVAAPVSSARVTSASADLPMTSLVSIDELASNVERAQEKLQKMQAMLEEARSANPDQVNKLESAVRKNEERVRMAQAELDKARAQPAPKAATITRGPVPSAEEISQLERAVARARNKAETMQQAVDTAKASDPERAAKLEPSLQASLQKLAEAEQQLAAAQAATTPYPSPAAETADKPSWEELENQLQKAEAKLAKMQEALEDARQNAPENVEKLQRAVEKNLARVDAARDAVIAAETQAFPGSSPMAHVESHKTPQVDLDELELQLTKAQDKLEKMQQALADAQAQQNVEQIEKLSRAVEKNQVRVSAAREALALARRHSSSGEH